MKTNMKKLITIIAVFAITFATAQKKQWSGLPNAVEEFIIGVHIDDINAKYGGGYILDGYGYKDTHGYNRIKTSVRSGVLETKKEIIFTNLKGEGLSYHRELKSKIKLEMDADYSINKAIIKGMFGTGEAGKINNHHKWYGYMNEELYEADIWFYKSNGKFVSRYTFRKSSEKID